MKKFIIFLLTVLTVCSCTGTRHVTQPVHDIQRDTVYVSNFRYDSVYVYQSHDRDYHPVPGTLKPDTVFVKDVSVEYRYKMLRDTVLKVRHDSIPYEVTIVETKEIVRPLTRFDRLTRLTFWLLIGAIAACLFIKTKRVFKKY